VSIAPLSCVGPYSLVAACSLAGLYNGACFYHWKKVKFPGIKTAGNLQEISNDIY